MENACRLGGGAEPESRHVTATTPGCPFPEISANTDPIPLKQLFQPVKMHFLTL